MWKNGTDALHGKSPHVKKCETLWMSIQHIYTIHMLIILKLHRILEERVKYWKRVEQKKKHI